MPRALDPSVAIAAMRQAGVEPLAPYPGSGRPWRSRCMRCGHEVSPTLTNVRSGHAACGYCARTMVDPAEAVAVMRAAGFEPLVAYPGSGKPWRCRCTTCNAEVAPSYAAVNAGNAACRRCADRRNGMAMRLSDDEAIARMTAAGLEPLDPYPGSTVPWRCRCRVCGSEVRPRLGDVSQGHGCSVCGVAAVRRALRLDDEAATRFMVERHLEPVAPYPGAATPWPCRCLDCGAEVTPRYDNIKAGWGGCQRCARRRQSARLRGDAALAEADLRAAGVEPLVPYPGVMTPWLGQCRCCGREVSPLLNNVRKGSRACAYCAGSKVDAADAAALMRAASLEPLVEYPGRHQPWPCRCTRCGRTVSPRYGAVVGGGGCLYCNDTAIDPVAAVALMRNAGLEPLEPYPGSNRPWRCECQRCHHQVSPWYCSVQRGTGCRFCAEYGFNPGAPAIVYLLTHARLGAAKVGIAGIGTGRLDRHRARGWEVLFTVEVPGATAEAIENDILGWWSELGLPPAVDPAQMPQGGFSETVDLTAIDLAATIRRIREGALAKAA